MSGTLIARCSLAALAAALFLLAPQAQAQDAPLIKQIDVKGARRVEEATVRFKLKSRVGDPYSPETLREDIKALYAFGFFDDVAVDADVFEGGLRLTFLLVEKPTIRAIKLEGNKKLSEEKIRGKITLAEGSIIGPGALGQNVDQIRALYEEGDFYLAQVDARTDSVSDREVDVIFRIVEGDKYAVGAVHIVGNNGLREKEITSKLETSPTYLFFFGGTLKREDLKRDLDRIRAVYLDHGYLDIRVDEPQIEVDRKRKKLLVTIRVEEGPQYRIGDFRIEGNAVFTDAEIRQGIKTAAGSVFSREALQADVLALTDRYAERGYLFADVAPVTRIRRDEHLVDVGIDVSEGKQAFVERIEIAGNFRTRDKVIRREMKLIEGDVYDSRLLQRGRQNLDNLGFFDEVKVDTRKGSADDRVNIGIEVKERPTGTFSFGGGFSSLDGPIGVVRLSQTNFFGLGQRAQIAAQVGTKAFRFNLGFLEPHLLDSDYSLGFNAFNERTFFQDLQGFDTDLKGGNITVGRQLTETLSSAVTYRVERVKIFDLLPNAPLLIRRQAAESDGISTTTGLGLTVAHDTRDNPMDPTRGLRVTTGWETAGSFLGGSNNFYKASVDTDYYHPLPWWRLVGRVHTNVSYGEAFSSTPSLPAQERYFLGGIGSIRGFRNFSISPIDAETGGRLGGNKAYYVNNEVLFPIIDFFKVRGLVFLDAGNVFDEGESYALALKTGAGPGLRMTTPFGPIGVAVGFNLNPKPGERQKVFHFSVGTGL